MTRTATTPANTAETALPGGQILDSLPSTNAALASDWHSYRDFEWLAAREQTAGKGRLGRTWVSPPGAALLVSVLVPVRVDQDRLGLVPLAAGLAVRDLLTAELPPQSAAELQLKWPNDVLLGGRKVAGILSQHVEARGADHLIVVGVGINLTQDEPQLAGLHATSLAQWSAQLPLGAPVPDATLGRLAEALSVQLRARTADLTSTAAQFAAASDLIGKKVTATLNGGEQLTGTATGIDPAGALLIDETPVTAGDVTLAASYPAHK